MSWGVEIFRNASLLPSRFSGTTLGNVPNNLLITAFNNFFSALSLLGFILTFDTIDHTPYLQDLLSLDLRDIISAIFYSFNDHFFTGPFASLLPLKIL